MRPRRGKQRVPGGQAKLIQAPPVVSHRLKLPSGVQSNTFGMHVPAVTLEEDGKGVVSFVELDADDGNGVVMLDCARDVLDKQNKSVGINTSVDLCHCGILKGRLLYASEID